MKHPFLKDIDVISKELKTDIQKGLSSEEAEKRITQFGKNKITEKNTKTVLSIFFNQIKEMMVIILIIAAIVSIFLNEYIDASVILIIVILNTILGFYQEIKAEKAMAALKKLAIPNVRIKRDDKELEVNATGLVPGDVIMFEAGNIIPADGRIFENINLKIQEAALTGESEPIEKTSISLKGKDIQIGDRKNMIHMGTIVTYGRGQAIVTDTGMNTELGNIATMLQNVDEDQTPLQKRLARLGKVLAASAVMLIAVVVVILFFKEVKLKEIFLISISMAVAAIPEGLPVVVTIALALGARRMLKKKSLIRNLPAVETLGSVTVICSDKTGTLTQNKMTVTEIVLPGKSIKMNDLLKKKIPEYEAYLPLVVGTLCNDAVLSHDNENNGPQVIGDPTEGSFVIASEAAGISQKMLQSSLPRVAEIPFDSERKRMTTVHKKERIENEIESILKPITKDKGDRHYIFTKGGTEGLMDICDKVFIDGNIKKITPETKKMILIENEKMSGKGIRVLGCACREIDPGLINKKIEYEKEMIFTGMICMKDPVRPEVKEAVKECITAGIRTVMITGDHPLTAKSIGNELGIGLNGKYLTGIELSKMDIDTLKKKIDEVSIFARVSPEHKMKIIDALQENNQIVSMTGDGVNDAPALKSADIGVAMGVTGTDVAKESSDMVLLDDNFTSIVRAVKEGRTIYDNIKKFIKYILSGNLSEIIVMLFGSIIGMPMPLRPIQILWINLVTDGAPAIGLAYEPSEPDVMKRPPFKPGETVFSRGAGRQIIMAGIIIGGVSLALGYLKYTGGKLFGFYDVIKGNSWQTMIFTTLTFCQMALVLSLRTGKWPIFKVNPFSNIPVLIAVIATFLLQLMLIYTPFFNKIFRTVPLNKYEIGTCLLVAAFVIIFLEVEKAISRVKERPKF
ncbi:cation-translocating P-type ATPase [Spirochaetota bacterium]